MNLLQYPELLDRLASSYALGTLRGGARRRFEALAREQAPVRAAALIWQSRLASLNELQPQAQPSSAVWTRIDNLVQGEKQSAAQLAVRAQAVAAEPAGLTGWLRSLTVWRTATAAGAFATITAVSVGIGMREELGGEIARLQTQLQSAPQIEYVAVLADDKSAASMLVTFDPKAKKLTLQRVGGYQEADDRSLQLWALPPSGGPKSLGVLGSDKLLRLTAGENDVREVPTLAISLEPKGGVPSEIGPTGPVLFKGALIQKML
ncbi:MAG: RNA polymerase subunit sigma-70 [Curvibacter sp. RIFCSPHIGHO2_12_FULL_63_18]|uniref:anti-sigma factor n=1 Tax=Rhodoferax sp. TaxID=50421 RepID=UPI0008C2F2BD|nr:anti-sigma factor [Rhodoferax sp.]OGO95818.1 MAG: RNA polymerase subunit sigma-70 [Curvibacter sp. GWA2_63_95]OGP05703.1 MAG: RNA polymerase subunit sigma-70 [Curvibacter sp. RIFCSPHIGHO2_12_FULL_63_18]HCX81603.1 RNA polymerase subunit sigma-70 [Rhodoferax sp.]